MKNTLVFDLDCLSLLGVVVGDVVADLPRDFDVCNKNLGYCIYSDAEKVTGIFICFNSGYRGYKHFVGKCIKDGVDIVITSSSQPSLIMRFFDGNYEHWNDGVDESLTINTKGYELEFNWSVDGEKLTLNYVLIN